jgi:hypothetical protein
MLKRIISGMMIRRVKNERSYITNILTMIVSILPLNSFIFMSNMQEITYQHQFYFIFNYIIKFYVIFQIE